MAKTPFRLRGTVIILTVILFFFAFGNSIFSQTCTVPDYGTGPLFHWARGSLVYYYFDENSNFDQDQLAQIQAAFREWSDQTLNGLNCSGVTFTEGTGSESPSLYLYRGDPSPGTQCWRIPFQFPITHQLTRWTQQKLRSISI
jgi:hypothetical protein